VSDTRALTVSAPVRNGELGGISLQKTGCQSERHVGDFRRRGAVDVVSIASFSRLCLRETPRTPASCRKPGAGRRAALAGRE
jgi:hypothetical protein